ncbi:hypothetical protein [Niveispirillum sp. BGYR6]|uniref:hypothetical protein n=1 Tax=Niveispirillum sp. BGYR6 TaxID=2971249 RepID=UPI0022B9C027|nr:hypothetical protein [Niveispirillum sp. BGYR6]MDG5495560.1 hypothetical protein [Niveispirillum sp. BGYR6]
MTKIDREKSLYWQKLRKDKISAAACGLMYVSVILATVSWGGLLVDGSHMQMRGNPVYWLVMMPGAIWLIGLMNYSKWSVKLMIPMMVILPLMCFFSFVYERKKYIFEISNGRLIVFAISTILSALAYILYRRSMLYREGPFNGQP